MSGLARYEVTVVIGPCSEADSEGFADSILGLPLARKVHAAVGIRQLDERAAPPPPRTTEYWGG